MNLLGWHGTVLRQEGDTGAWFHAQIWPDDDSAADLVIAVPEAGLAHARPIDGMVAEPAAEGTRIHLRRQHRYLRADPMSAFVHFENPLAGPLETFLPVTPALLRSLRAVLAGQVRIMGTDTVTQAICADGFMLRVQGDEYAIAVATPAPHDGLTLRNAGQVLTLEPVEPATPPARTEISLVPVEPPPAASAGEFMQGRSAILRVADAVDIIQPPTTLSDADQIWMQQSPWFPERQFWGPMASICEIGRTRDANVLLARSKEGGIFDEAGFFTDPVHLAVMPLFDTGGFTRHGKRVFIDDAALRDAPVLPGPHVIFYGGLVVNYFHWMLEALVPLSILAPHLPPGTTLLLPESLTASGTAVRGGLMPRFLDMLRDWGFGDMPRRVVPGSVCRVEEVFWLRNLNLDSIPGICFRRVRERALASLPALPPDHAKTRLYIRRPGQRRVANAAVTEAALTARGFTAVDLSGLSPREQMALFREACFVVSPHGADLANLLFCAPGTKIVELTPDLHFRGFYGHLSDKLGLSHAILPCATRDGSFDADFLVDIARLTALIDLMQARA